MLGSANPSTIQKVPASAAAGQLPLVLIHDGGGTCFSYRLLEFLGRPVYGIHNPRFQSGRPWKGGIEEMARVYVELVRSLFPTGAFILGGWSLGGLISLQMAKLLEGDDELCVAGVVMIDSVFPVAVSDLSGKQGRKISNYVPELSKSCPIQTRVCVHRSFVQSVAMLATWTPPRWNTIGDYEYDDSSSDAGSATSGDTLDTSSHSSGSSSLGPPRMFEGQSPNQWLWSVRRRTRPTVVLLRAAERVPSPAGATHRVDLLREERDLGWRNHHHPDLVSLVVDVPGHHFDLFAPHHVGLLSAELRSVCREMSAVYLLQTKRRLDARYTYDQYEPATVGAYC